MADSIHTESQDYGFPDIQEIEYGGVKFTIAITSIATQGDTEADFTTATDATTKLLAAHKDGPIIFFTQNTLAQLEGTSMMAAAQRTDTPVHVVTYDGGFEGGQVVGSVIVDAVGLLILGTLGYEFLDDVRWTGITRKQFLGAAAVVVLSLGSLAGLSYAAKRAGDDQTAFNEAGARQAIFDPTLTQQAQATGKMLVMLDKPLEQYMGPDQLIEAIRSRIQSEQMGFGAFFTNPATLPE